jgi:SAM-dependent methyltransferase
MSYLSLNFSPGDERLKTASELRTADTLVIDALVGVVLYGPYLDLLAGEYEARIHLAPAASHSGAVTMDLASENGTHVIAEKRFDLGELDPARPVLSIKFTLPRSVQAFEARLHSDGGALATISNVELLHFEATENLVDRWEATGARALHLSQTLAACTDVMQRIADEFPIRRYDTSQLFPSRFLQYPAMRRENLLCARLFCDRGDLISHMALGPGAKIAEIGVAHGEFSQFLIDCLKPEEFHAFDLFGLERLDTVMGMDSKAMFEGMTHLDFYRKRLANAATKVEIHPGDSKRVLPEIAAAQFDLVYVDAGHYYKDVKPDALEAARIVRPDGIIVFNDYMMFDHLSGDPYGVVRAVNELVVEDDWKVVAFALQHQMFCDIALARVAPEWVA